SPYLLPGGARTVTKIFRFPLTNVKTSRRPPRPRPAAVVCADRPFLTPFAPVAPVVGATLATHNNLAKVAHPPAQAVRRQGLAAANTLARIPRTSGQSARHSGRSARRAARPVAARARRPGPLGCCGEAAEVGRAPPRRGDAVGPMLGQ